MPQLAFPFLFFFCCVVVVDDVVVKSIPLIEFKALGLHWEKHNQICVRCPTPNTPWKSSILDSFVINLKTVQSKQDAQQLKKNGKCTWETFGR